MLGSYCIVSFRKDNKKKKPVHVQYRCNIFLLNIFNLRLVESINTKLVDIEGYYFQTKILATIKVTPKQSVALVMQ